MKKAKKIKARNMMARIPLPSELDESGQVKLPINPKYSQPAATPAPTQTAPAPAKTPAPAPVRTTPSGTKPAIPQTSPAIPSPRASSSFTPPARASSSYTPVRPPMDRAAAMAEIKKMQKVGESAMAKEARMGGGVARRVRSIIKKVRGY